MTLTALLEKKREELARRLDRRVEKVDAVYDDQLWSILDEWGMLKALDAGHLRCHLSGVPLTRENVGGIVVTPQGPKLIADTYYTGSGKSE